MGEQATRRGGGVDEAGLVTSLLLGRNIGGIALSVLFATGIVYLVRRSRVGGLGRPVHDSSFDR